MRYEANCPNCNVYNKYLRQGRCQHCGAVLAETGGRQCTPSTPIVWVKCCRIWPIVPGYPIGTCGICGTVPVVSADEPSEVSDEDYNL